jgi:hypothetical protein
MKKLFLIVCLLAFVLAGCKAYYTEDAWGRDYLFSVEITKRGYYRIWFTHDDVSAYCTVNSELGKQAMNLLKEHDGEVLFHFFDSEIGDPEADWWSTTKCGQGIYDTKVWIIDDIIPVDGRQ